VIPLPRELSPLALAAVVEAVIEAVAGVANDLRHFAKHVLSAVTN
jgi:hypothetical protein